MVKKSCLLLLMLIALASPSQSQVNFLKGIFGDEQEIVFDVNGKMITYPATFVKPGTKLKFKVRSAANIYDPYIIVLKKNLKESLNYMSETETEKAYRCYFENEVYDAYVNAYNKLLNLPEKNCNYNALVDTLKKMKVNDKIPVFELIDNIKNQHFVKVFINSTCVDIIKLSAAGNCGSGCIDFEAEEYKRLRDMNCESCLAQNPVFVRFELVKDDPWNKTIRDWFTEKAKDFNRTNTFDPLINNPKPAANTTISDSAYTAAIKFDTLKGWFLNWFWFNGGKLALDPFNVVTGKGKETLTDEIKDLEKAIRIANEKIIFYDSAKAIARRDTSVDISDFETLINDQDVIKTDLAKDIAEKEKLEKLLINESFVRISSNTVLYEGKLQPSKSWSLANKSINPHKQFDAFLGFKPIRVNLFDRRKIAEIPENEHMYIAVHNVPDTITAIRFTEKTLPFNDLEEFTKILGEQLSAYEATTGSVTNIKNLEEFIRAVTVTGIGLKGAPNKHLEMVKCVEIRPFLQGLVTNLKEGILTYPPKPDLFSKLTYSAPVNRTEISATTSEDAPFRDSVVIRAVRPKDSADVAKTFVKVGKLRFFQLAAGIAVARKPASITNIDTTGNGFRVSASDNRSTAIFGVKIYPFKNYNRDHGLIPRYPLRRLSVMGAFELLHPLDNFYLGGSYDIIPGLAFSAGTNWYLRTSYQVENNVITKTSKSYERSGTYYSVTVNPVLFAQFVKLFFKTI